MFKVIVANRFSQDSLIRLKQSSKISFTNAEDIGQLKNDWADCQGLLIRSGTRADKDFLSKFPALKVIITATSGFDHIDLKACKEKGISVMHTPEANAISAAEHAWGMILASKRKYNLCQPQIHSGNWDRAPLMGQELHGRTLGIVGYGRIGKKVYNFAKAFGMNVVVHDPYVEHEAGVKYLGLEEVIRKSDILTLHVPLTTETNKMINITTLDWFGDHATLVNTSRGNAIDMNPLIAYLADRPNFYLALDVFPTEPPPKTSPLLKHPRVVCTPHVGANTEQALARASREAVEKMMEFVNSGKASDTLPPDTLWAAKLIN